MQFEEKLGHIRISEIFESVQGEGPKTGIPTTFVRTAGCTMRCSGWGVETTLPSGKVVVGCDSPHSVFPELFNQPGGSLWLSPSEVLGRVPVWPKNVCVTGGEPLLQWKTLSTVVDALLYRGQSVEIFTNGSLLAPSPMRMCSPMTYVMDFKLPSSGEYGKFNTANFARMAENDCIKFVVGDRNDFKVAIETIEEHGRGFKGTWLLGPVWQKLDPHELIRWILKDGHSHKRRIRLSLQTQSLIGADEAERYWKKIV